MTRYVDDKPEGKITHPSFGMISIHRRHGAVDQLFGTDYPQGHSISITISECELQHQHGQESYYPSKNIIQIEMSEVQYARMLSNPNSTGTPCTLRHRQTGDMVALDYPPAHMFDAEKAKGNIKDTARKISGNFDHAAAKVAEFIDGKPPTKAQLRELLSVIKQAQQGIASDLPFYVQSAEEKIDTSVLNGKTEFDAYVQSSLAELGRRTLQDQIASGNASPLSLSAPTMPENS